MSESDIDTELLTPREAAQRLGVNAKTLTRWSLQGLVPCLRTLGGHRRYDPAVVEGILNKGLALDEASRRPAGPLRSRMAALTQMLAEEGHMTPYARDKVLAVIDAEGYKP